MVKVYKQLSIFLANQPGTLAKVLKLLAVEKINILGLMVTDSIDHAVVRLVVDDNAKATHILGDHGLLVIRSEVIGVHLADKPGALMQVATRLAKAKVNIAYTYATDGTGGEVLGFIRPSDMTKAKRALASLNKSKKKPAKKKSAKKRKTKKR